MQPRGGALSPCPGRQVCQVRDSPVDIDVPGAGHVSRMESVLRPFRPGLHQDRMPWQRSQQSVSTSSGHVQDSSNSMGGIRAFVGESSARGISVEVLPGSRLSGPGSGSGTGPHDVRRRIHDIFEGCVELTDPVPAVESHICVPAIEDLGTGMLPQIQFAISDLHVTAATRTARLPTRNKQSSPQRTDRIGASGEQEE